MDPYDGTTGTTSRYFDTGSAFARPSHEQARLTG
jgi:hypothetical protein